MAGREISSALKYVSRHKKSFMLSELGQYMKEGHDVGQVYEVVAPLLESLGLRAVPADGDYRIERLPPSARIELNAEERARQEAYFSGARVPRDLERLIEKYVEKKAAKPWDDPAVLEKIRRAVAGQKAQYWKAGGARKIDYRSGYSVLGYLAYQFPVYFVQAEHILYDMARDGLLKRRGRMLDAGAGPGSFSLAAIDFYRRLDEGSLEAIALERSDENVEAYTALVPEFADASGKATAGKPIRADLAGRPKLPGSLDLIVFSNVLNEIDAPLPVRADIVMHCAQSLAPDGSIVVVEPADRDNSIAMRQLVVELLDRGMGLYSPCSFVWCARCRPGPCWSFEEREDIAPTALMKKVAGADEPYRYLNTDIKYTFAILRRDELTKEKYRVPPKAKFARMSKLKLHVGKRINVVASKMSRDLGNRKDHVFKICDGTTSRPAYAILPNYNIGPGNEALMKAEYGEVLAFRNILVRYNRERDAYNLMVGKGTTIGPAGEGDEQLMAAT